MRRLLRAPKNPEVLGRLIAALRVYGGQRQPTNEMERKIDQALRDQRIAPSVVNRMVGTLDSISKSSRAKLLGKIAAPDFVAAARVREPTVGPVSTPFPAAAFISSSGLLGALSEVFSRNPDVTPLPLYTVRYQGLYCQKEMSWDQGSWDDEVYLITSAVHIDADGNNAVRTERHPATQDESWYDDVDSGEERIGPVAAVWQGNSDPVSVTVVLFEHDQGDPDAYKEEIDTLVKAAIAILTKIYPPAAVLALVSDTITDGINWLLDTGDDIISTETVVLPRTLLELYSTQGFHSFHFGQRLDVSHFPQITIIPISTHLMYHFITEHAGGGATYVLGFDVAREPPLELPQPIL